MPQRTAYAHGTFSWIDNPTTDQDAARSFYSAIFGWDYDDVPVPPDLVYSLATLRGQVVGAIAPQMQDERDLGVPPHWNSYVAVDDVDAVAARVAEQGGRLHLEPFDVGGDAGRMAPVSDPTGAVFYLWQAGRRHGVDLVNEPGALCWNELVTRNPDVAVEFYSGLLGWSFEEIPDIPGLRYWVIRNGERDNGGMRILGDDLPPETPAHWLVYFAVEDIEQTADRAASAGGELVVPKTAAGGDNHFAVLRDPVGAVFATFQGWLDD